MDCLKGNILAEGAQGKIIGQTLVGNLVARKMFARAEWVLCRAPITATSQDWAPDRRRLCNVGNMKHPLGFERRLRQPSASLPISWGGRGWRPVVLWGLAWAIFGCLAAAAPQGNVININVSRLVDISTQMARVKTTYNVNGVGQTYSFGLPAGSHDHLAFLSATVNSGNVDPERRPEEDAGGLAMYAVDTRGGGDKVEVVVLAVYTDVLEPFPKEITQLEDQMVVYRGKLLVGSPYLTTSQKTTVRLASTKVAEFTEVPGLSSVKGDKVFYGPFKDVQPLDEGGDLRIHYMNHSPFAKVSTLLREIEVSNWGNIAVEEHYNMEHAGAKLRGGFSRMDYMGHRHESLPNPSFRRLEANLPARAKDIYYRDNIGNVSTSTVKDSFDGVDVSILPRFPLYGGWKTAWYQGYNLPSEEGLRHNGPHFRLSMPFAAPFQAVWVEDLTVKVILPEGAKNVVVTEPFASVMEARTKRFTFLDTSWGGRPVMILTMKNVVKEHNVIFHVTYDFNQWWMLQEPFLLAAFFLAFFVAASVASRLGDIRRRTNGPSNGRGAAADGSRSSTPSSAKGDSVAAAGDVVADIAQGAGGGKAQTGH